MLSVKKNHMLLAHILTKASILKCTYIHVLHIFSNRKSNVFFHKKIQCILNTLIAFSNLEVILLKNHIFKIKIGLF
jgi:hypothetical protein